jgi:serine/threonine protein kinase
MPFFLPEFPFHPPPYPHIIAPKLYQDLQNFTDAGFSGRDVMSMIGKSLAHYAITSLIGKGGMGEVYRAKDQKLGRDVAIKVLPAEFALDADRAARFQREAKLLASLNHPNIAAIHGLEESDGTHFLVLELIEGETLADRIKAGAIPVEETLKLALQIAEALEAAHDKGVIHRDLKPANIKITPDGKVKVLDFGLAKAYVGEPEDMNLSNSPTLSDAATRQGVILGTSAYMPPEQAKGKTVDKRADIWAFGVVLFEMLTGRQLFTGETVSETLASVIKSEPEWQSLPPNLHPRIRFLLERCLKKDPKDRYSGISDARVDIREVLADPKGLYAQPAPAGSGAKSKQVLVWASITVALIIIAAAVVWNLKTRESPQMSYSEFTLPADQQFNRNQWGNVHLAISPDGSQFVYGTTQGLFVRSVDKLDEKPVSGSDNNAEAPFFSPDGREVGYYSPTDRKVKKIPVNGGTPVPLCDIETSLAGAQWRSDKTIVFAMFPGGIFKVPDSGGKPESLFKTDTAGSTEGGGNPIVPQILPDGENVLFTDLISGDDKQITVQSIETGERKTLFPGQGAWYSPSGHILYGEINTDKLYAVPFDLDRLEVTGGPVPILEGVLGVSMSESGTMVYVRQPNTAPQAGSDTGSSDASVRTLWWVDRNGREDKIQIQAPARTYAYPKISPDGTKVALTAEVGGNIDIWILDLVRGTPMRLTFDDSEELQAIWSPDGEQIAYTSNRNKDVIAKGGITGIFTRAANASGGAKLLYLSPDKVLLPFCWSADGKMILTTEADTGFQNMDTGIVSMEGDPLHKFLLQESYYEFHAQISPDGRWVAYCSTEAYPDKDGSEIYVRSFPDLDKGGKYQVSTGGGHCPRWSPDGKELYYIVGGNVIEAMMAVEVETDPTFKAGTPKVLFQGSYLGSVPNNGVPYDVHPDGNRFLMMKPPRASVGVLTDSGPRKIIIVKNWFEELSQKAPAD